MEHYKNEDVGEVVAVAVFARCAAHHLEDVDAFHKEVGDKCFHEDLTYLWSDLLVMRGKEMGSL